MSVLDQVVEFCRVLASEVLGPNAAVTMNVASSVGGFNADQDAADLSDDAAEQATQQPAWQSLGVVARPLPPTSAELFAEALSLKRADGLEPFAYRDLRINRALNPTGAGSTPAAGQTMLAGYGGAFLSHQLAGALSGSARPNISAIYVPYQFDGQGVPTKAHAIIVDPITDTIQLVHGEGVFFQLTGETGSGPGIVAAVDGETFLRMSAGELVLQAEKVMLKGNVYLGAAAETGVPLLAGAASPPGPSIFISPV